MCGKPLPRGRKDRKFDSDKCRQRFHRWAHRERELREEVIQLLEALKEYANYPQFCDASYTFNLLENKVKAARKEVATTIKAKLDEIEASATAGDGH